MRKAPWFAVLLGALATLGTAGAQTPDRPLLFPNPIYVVPAPISKAASGDVNGDGWPDLAVVNGGAVTILLGQGDALMQPLPGPVVSAVDIVLADLNDDGMDDLVINRGDAVLAFLAAGDGAFGSPGSVPNPYSRAPVVADMNGDGHPDLVMPNATLPSNGVVRIALNQGNGTFGAPVDVPLGFSGVFEQVRVEDFNGDGKPDVFANVRLLSGGGTDLRVFPGGLPLVFGPGSLYHLPYSFTSVAIADFNVDGRLDVIATGSFSHVLLGNGNGTFTEFTQLPPLQSFTVLDFNSDGIPDVAQTANLNSSPRRILLKPGTGSGTFGGSIVVPGDSTRGLLSVDVNLDGRDDVVTLGMNPSRAVGILLNGPGHAFGRRTLGAPPGGPVFVRDFDGDGRDDLLVAGEAVTLFPWAANVGYEDTQVFAGAPPSSGGHRGTILDADGDGDSDIALVAPTGVTTVILGQGGGAFGAPVTYTGGDGDDSIASVDLESDGDEDIAEGCINSICFRNALGGGVYNTFHWRYSIFDGYQSLVGVDLNQDGRKDFVGTVASASGRSIVSVIQQPDGTFLIGETRPIPLSGKVRLLADDLDADGWPDVAFFVKGSGLGVLRGAPGGSLTVPVYTPTAAGSGATWSDVIAADFDLDGHLDIALLEHFEDTTFATRPHMHLLEILPGNGAGGFSASRLYVGPDDTDRFEDPRMVVGHFDDDPLPDLAFASELGAITIVQALPALHVPIANAGSDDIVECQSPAGAIVLMDGSASTDSDSTVGTNDDIATFEWFSGYGTPQQALVGSGPQVTVPLPFGISALTLRTTDWSGRWSVDDLSVTVVDTVPPVLTTAADSGTLWPPNHRMVPVSVSVSASDLCGPATLSFASAASSEPDDAPGAGDGQTSADVQGASPGTLDTSFVLRAERDANGPGRTYSLAYQALDSHGNPGVGSVEVVVPHDVAGITEPLTLHVDENANGTVVSWNPVPGALWYNVVFGDLSRLRALPSGDVPAVCLASVVTGLDTTGSEVNFGPEVGQAYYFLVEYDDGRPSGYGTESAPFDRSPVAPSSACP